MHPERTDRRADDALKRPDNRVALFVDYENLRKSLEHHFDPTPSPQALCEKLYEIASRFGHVLIANAYADWSISGTDAREFRRRQIEPRLVLTKENGDDRTDITMSLDALESLFDDPPIDVYVIASGDSDFHDLLQRFRRRGKRVVVTSVRPDTGRELIRGSDRFLPLDDVFGVRTPRQVQPVNWDTYDWTGFVRLIRDLDRKLNFVGLRYVATKVLNPHNCGLSDRSQKQELLNRAIDSKIIIPYQVENIEEGGEPVSACRLNLAHPMVAETLTRLEESESAPAARPKTEAGPADTEPEEAPAEEAGPDDAAGAGTPEEEAGEESPSRTPTPRFQHSSTDGDDLGRPGENI